MTAIMPLNSTTRTVLCLLLCFSIFSCSESELVSDLLIYDNDFENGNLEGISSSIGIMEFDGQNVIGNFNNDGFRLTLNEIPEHDLIFISFDLLIHDTWDGNTNGTEPDGPDKWIFRVNPGIRSKVSNRIESFETTFSNSVCFSNYCLKQSFPSAFPFNSNPKTGSSNNRLPGLCALAGTEDGTTLYRFSRTFEHDERSIILEFWDELVQPNALDTKCDESWSIDNIIVRAIDLD